jgi:hypothetical protein
MAARSFPKLRLWSALASALKSSGMSCVAVSEMARTVAHGMPNSRQTAWMVPDSISTASAPVPACSVRFCSAVTTTCGV